MSKGMEIEVSRAQTVAALMEKLGCAYQQALALFKGSDDD